MTFFFFRFFCFSLRPMTYDLLFGKWSLGHFPKSRIDTPAGR